MGKTALSKELQVSTVKAGGRELSLNERMEISQVKRVEQAFGGLRAAWTSALMLNLFSKNACDPFEDFGVCVSLDCENKSGRCKTWGKTAGHTSDPRSSQVLFWGVCTLSWREKSLMV